MQQAAIVLATVNARYSHAALGIRALDKASEAQPVKASLFPKHNFGNERTTYH